MNDLRGQVGKAVRHFWVTRRAQERKQGSKTGRRDQGSRSAVTGGAQLDGFIRLVSELLIDSGIPDATIFRKQSTELPGFFRPTKEWDLLVVVDGNLLASIEFKSQVGPSFGNNYNNRTEEALGSATDLWTAYREGAFAGSPRPWLGYFMLLEETNRSISPVAVTEPHFNVREEFRGASYAKRYELFCQKLVRERLYDAACFILSDKATGLKGQFVEPSPELGFARFVTSLTSCAIAYSRTKSQS
ncbi:MAG: PaeR7I family type II restriction endonuclease [Candidatus Methylomirabilota bacterium]